jgi:thioredoxin 1
MKYIFALLLALSLPYYATAAELTNITDIKVAEQHAQENDKQLILIFTAPWCQYCQPLKKQVMDNMEDINEQGWVVCFVDYDSNKNVAKKYGVTKLPTSVFLNGEKRSTQVGYSNYQGFERNFKK